MDAAKLKEYRGQIDERQKALHDIFEEAGPDIDMSKVKCIEGDESVKVERIRSLNDELSELGVKAEPLEKEYADLERAKRHAEEYGEKNGHPAPEPSGNKGGGEPEQKSVGEQITDLSLVEHKGKDFDLSEVGLKTLFQTSAGWAPESLRTGQFVDKAVRPIQILDILPSGETEYAVVKFMEEETFTNNAAGKKEGEELPESALKVVEAESPVRKIGTFISVTDEQLEDVSYAQSFLNRRIPFMVRQKLDEEVVKGNGANPNLKGFLEVGGVQEQAKGADPTPDAIYKGLVLCRVTGRALPSAVFMHPNDWMGIRLLRTEQGVYIWGNPSEAGPERIWSVPVVQADVVTENTALLGDFANYSELVMRRGIQVKVSESHSDFFVKDKQAIKASVRAALVVLRPAAFVKVTGI